MAGELAEAQATSAELSGERDELAGSLANLEAEHANLLDAHSSLKCAGILEALHQTISNSRELLWPAFVQESGQLEMSTCSYTWPPTILRHGIPKHHLDS